MEKKHISYRGLVLLLTILVLILVFAARPSQTQAVNGNCGTAFNITAPQSTTALTDVVSIDLMGNGTATSVKFMLDGQIIGRGFSDNTASAHWRMDWDTKFATSGTAKQLTAVVKNGSGYECQTNPIGVSIANPTQLPLEATIDPLEWSGSTNSITFFLIEYPEGAGGPVNIPKFADVVWSVANRGNITPLSGGNARYNSGPIGGNGVVTARVSYGGQTLQVNASTIVIPQAADEDQEDYNASDGTSGQGGATNTNDGTTSGTDDGSSDTMRDGTSTAQTSVNPAVAITRVLEDTTIRECLVGKLGQAEVDQLVADNRRPNSVEFELVRTCFQRQKYVLPSALAPVAPEDVADRPESNKISIREISNQIISREQDNADQTVLVLSGTAGPNASVILYIFSEPLVLATTTDADGNWTYTLEDPVESGAHEVYALVDRGDGEYVRSGLSTFVIGQASASADNPSGLGLQLIAEPTIGVDNSSTNTFIAATVGIITLTTVVLSALFVYRTKKNNTNIAFETPSTEIFTPENTQDSKQTPGSE